MRPAMHAAETAGGEDPDAGERREVGGGRDGGRPGSAERGEDRQVAHARLGELLLRDPAHALGVEPDPRDAVEHGDGRRRDVPLDLSSSSNSSAASWLRGRGRPWEMIVDSSATTGRPSASASATSAEIRRDAHRVRIPHFGLVGGTVAVRRCDGHRRELRGRRSCPG